MNRLAISLEDALHFWQLNEVTSVILILSALLFVLHCVYLLSSGHIGKALLIAVVSFIMYYILVQVIGVRILADWIDGSGWWWKTSLTWFIWLGIQAKLYEAILISEDSKLQYAQLQKSLAQSKLNEAKSLKEIAELNYTIVGKNNEIMNLQLDLQVAQQKSQ
ncbi:hypothetical protein KA405_03895 [Patescibacteria group bacterium]|nr:hypothetical protein [Patescibacteria group bacterium]